MSFKLEKPYSKSQKVDFIYEYNHQKGMRIFETEKFLYALEDDEIMENDVPVLNPEYDLQQIEKLKQEQKLLIQNQLDELDKKRIRAICEPSMKTETESWLDFYNKQVLELRQVMAEL